ncbi:MAG: N-glycosylase/DNA lyase [Candidatus Marinimicrobia bacterium]|jgi:N-glycosylase/DNA lyase|nr:N-glycosylase/DNA lyase [Candidatus Neomarinimicrobiota bacterium]
MTRNTLIKKIKNLQKSDVKITITKRIVEFKRIGNSSDNEIFKELCFCLLTANYDAKKAINIQQKMDNVFLIPDLEIIRSNLKLLGYRFPNVRAKYIFLAQQHKDDIREIINKHKNNSSNLRQWFVNNIKGLGYKESSHFLRNIGFLNYAILDFHIIDILNKNGVIKRPKTLTPTKYIEIEDQLKYFSNELDLQLGELDFYLWYLEVGEIFK